MHGAADFFGAEFVRKALSWNKLGRNMHYAVMRFMVRQAKPGGSSQLKGTDHGNCSLAM
jgi:hypothetical protein